MSPKSHDPADPEVVAEQHVVQAQVAWITCARRAGSTGSTRSSNRSSTRSTWARRAASGHVAEQQPELGRVGEVPQDLVVGGGVEKAAQRPAQPGRGLPRAPGSPAVSGRVRGHRPGRNVKSRTG
jgi:hypothetical protein